MTTYSHGVEKNNGKELRRKKMTPPLPHTHKKILKQNVGIRGSSHVGVALA